MTRVMVNEPAAERRRMFFQLVGTDGITPANLEAGGQPQISTNGAAWTNTGIGTLVLTGNGAYYADLLVTAIATIGDRIRSRYASARTAECPAETDFEVVGFDPYADPLANAPAITVLGPVLDAETVTIIRGDDYLAADGRSLDFTYTSAADLTGASVSLLVGVATLAGTIINPTLANKTLRFDVARTITAALELGNLAFAIRITAVDGDIATVAQGIFEVSDPI